MSIVKECSVEHKTEINRNTVLVFNITKKHMETPCGKNLERVGDWVILGAHLRCKCLELKEPEPGLL